MKLKEKVLPNRRESSTKRKGILEILVGQVKTFLWSTIKLFQKQFRRLVKLLITVEMSLFTILGIVPG